MLPDDPRHGTTRGFHAGCRQPCCRRAIARYEKRRRLMLVQGQHLATPAIGPQRRIQALMALGWTSADIANAAGWASREYVRRVLKGQKGKPTTWVQAKTHAAIRDVYDALSMSIPEPTPARRRTQTRARRNGWPPPLAWDDERIDDPNYQPRGMRADEPRPQGTLLEEWAHLRRSGVSMHAAAAQLGVTVGAIEKATERAARGVA
jgi:hypothetical protein